MNNLIMARNAAFLCVLYWVSLIAVANTPIIFATPPTQATEETIKRYKPLADHLSKVIGRPVKLVTAENFIEYSQSLLDNKYDLIFDGPQFVGWRIEKFNHQVLAKLPKTLGFVIIIDTNSKISHYRKLAGRHVCAVGSPNLMTLGMLALYPNPASVPIINAVNSFKAAIQCLRKGEGRAAVIPTHVWKKMPVEKKIGLKLLYVATVKWPHRGFSVGTRVDKVTQDKLRRALLSADVREAAKPIFTRYKAQRFEPATNAEYQGLGKLLKPIWGFH